MDPAAPPDPALLAEVIADQGVVTEQAAPWGAYSADLRDGVAAVLSRLLGGTSGASTLADVIAVVLIVGLPLLAIALFRRQLWRGLKALWPGGRSSIVLDDAPPALPDDTVADARALLADGRPRDALAAVWRALGRTLTERGVAAWHPELTHGELVRDASRRAPTWPHHAQLGELAARCDRLAYGPDAPEVPDVAAVVDAAEALT